MTVHRLPSLLLVAALLSSSGCEYVRMLRPSVLKQLNPRMVRLVNYLPEVDEPNEAIISKLFALGGLAHAKVGDDGIMRVTVRAPEGEFIWEPAIVVMPRAGELELDIANDDFVVHAAYLPSEAGRQILYVPTHQRGRATLTLDAPGYYFFGCPVSNHAGRGMLGLIIVEGDVPIDARLDRPPQPQPDRF